MAVKTVSAQYEHRLLLFFNTAQALFMCGGSF
jgi:hypothetical protein